jgi:hypothetical protein
MCVHFLPFCSQAAAKEAERLRQAKEVERKAYEEQQVLARLRRLQFSMQQVERLAEFDMPFSDAAGQA